MNLNHIYHEIQTTIHEVSDSVQYAELGGENFVSVAEFKRIEESAMDKFESERGFFDDELFDREFEPNCSINPYDKWINTITSF